ncbi:class I SAM-dependent methyltransferase [Thermodesulfitimonas autotrophica]|uniref:class I SAM-dependent methyltransferase n=1 Tax=Thermodesulfitimonas autotrophica TaxID=1894989 RepID=UPI003FCDACE6
MLDLGCGPNKLSGAIGVDFRPGPGVDVVHNLNVYPWPFADNEFDLVYASHILEHPKDVVRTIEEIYRITKAGQVVRVLVPNFSSADFFPDPTHRHSFGVPPSITLWKERSYAVLAITMQGSKRGGWRWTSPRATP